MPIVRSCLRHRVLYPLGKRCPACTREQNASPVQVAHRSRQHERIRRAVFAHDGYACVYCGAEDDLTVDYVVPLAFGGEMSIENAVCACRSCNSSRGSRARHART